MKPKYYSKAAGRPALLASFIIVSFASQSVWAADITQSTGNAANTSGFNSGTGWPGGIAPAPGNNYFTSLLLRTPQAAGAFSFAGDSLTLNSGSALFIKSSSGTSATNIITVNNLILNGGTTAVGFGVNDTVSVTLAGAITVSANSSLSAQGNASNNSGSFEVLAITAPISGAAGTTLTIAGGTANTGAVRFSAANTYGGTVTVATPTNGFVASAVNRLLQLNNLNAVQNATLNLTSVANGLSFAAAANTGAFNIGALTGSSNQVLTDTASAPVTLNIGSNNANSTYAGILSGTGAVVKSGNGTLTLSGAGTYAGSTTVSAGTLSLGSASLKNTSSVLIASGATLNLTHGGTDRVAGLTIAGVPQPEGIYGPVGSGAANTTSAITGSGFLQVVASTAQDISLVATDALNTSSFDTGLKWSDALPPAPGNRYYTEAFGLRSPTAAGAFTFAGDSLSLDYGGGFLGKGAGGNTTQSITINNLMLNGGSLFQAQAANDTAVLNLFGSVNVNVASPLGALGATANDNVNFETLDIQSTISGAGSLTVAGTANGGANTGVVKLSAANPYSGTITVAQPGINVIASTTNRLLQLNHLDALANATLTLNTTAQNGISFASAANTGVFNIGALAGTANQTLTDTAGAGIILNAGGNGASTTYSGALSGAGALTKSGAGTLTLAGGNFYTGDTTVTAGSLILTNSFQSIGNLTVSDGAGTGLKVASADATSTTTGLTLGTSGPTTLAFDFNSLDTVSPLLTTGAFTANGTVNVTMANGNFLTAGTHPLIGYTSFSGTALSGTFALGPRSNGTLVNDIANNVLKLNVTADMPKWTGLDNGNWVLGTTGASRNWKLVAANSPANYLETDVVLFDDSAIGTHAVVISAANVTPASTTFNTNAGYSLGGAFGIAGSGPFVKDGSGTLTLTNVNSFTGPTTILAGTLQIGDGTTDGSIAATSNIVNDGTLVYNRVGSSSYGGVISGNGSLVKSGPGTQILTAANTYFGTTTVTGGLLKNGINNTLPITTDLTVSGGTYDLAGFDQRLNSLSDGGAATGTVTNSGALKTLTLIGGSDTVFSGEISGTLGVVHQGFGKLTLPDSNSYTGTTRIISGTVSLGNDGALGTGALDFAGGTIQSSDSTARTITNPINFSANMTFSGTGNLTFTATPPANGTNKTLTVENPQTEFLGVLGGASARIKEGGGLLIFSGLNNYTGATTVNAGTLRIVNPVLANAAAVVIAADAFLDLPYAGTDQVGSLTIDGVVKANGLYGAIGSAATYQVAAITGTGLLQVGPPGFSGFMDGFTGLTAAQKLPGEDPDNDGLSNLIEYALAGFDPTVSNPSPGTLVGGVLSFTKRALAVGNGDLSYAIERSTTLGLGSWTVVTPVLPDVNNSTTISYTLPPGGPREFARLRILQN